jgi:hypothetical protein
MPTLVSTVFRVALLLVATSGGAQGAAPWLDPGLDEGADATVLIDRMFEALGGRDAVAELRSLETDARCSGPGGDFRTRVDSFRPGFVFFQQSAGGQTTEVWSTPERTWGGDGSSTPQDLDPGFRSFVRAHEFHLMLFELESRFTNRRLGASEAVDGEPARPLLMDDEDGRPAVLWLRERDAQPLVLELNPPGAAGPLRITFDDWRPVGELRCFHAFTLAEGPDRAFTYAFDVVAPGRVPAERFVLHASPEHRADQAALLEILRDEQRAHLEGDLSLLAPHLAPSQEPAAAGGAHPWPRSTVLMEYEVEFAHTAYITWEDAWPPAFRFSDDGSTAWVARSVRSSRRHLDAESDRGGLAEKGEGRVGGSGGRAGATAGDEADDDTQVQGAPEVFAFEQTCTFQEHDGAWVMTSRTLVPDR